MILQIIVTPKSFYSCSTDLTVRGWVYNMEDSTKTFKGHQHSVSQMLLEGDTCKLGHDVSRHVCCQVTKPGAAHKNIFLIKSSIKLTWLHGSPHGNLAWPNLDMVYDNLGSIFSAPSSFFALITVVVVSSRRWTGTPTP